MLRTCFFVSLLMYSGTFAASTHKEIKCSDDKFYDHGTELCEPCLDICKYADIMGTVEQCQDMCPTTYAQLSSKQKEQVAASDFSRGNPTDPELPGNSASPTTTLATTLIIVGLAVVVVLVLGGAVVLYRRRQQARLGTNGRTVEANPTKTDRRTRGGYRLAGVQEENGEQAESERLQQSEGLLGGSCDPRNWFAGHHGEETTDGRQGAQELVVLGSSHGSGIQELSQPKTFIVNPVYRPSGPMRSTRV